MPGVKDLMDLFFDRVGWFDQGVSTVPNLGESLYIYALLDIVGFKSILLQSRKCAEIIKFPTVWFKLACFHSHLTILSIGDTPIIGCYTMYYEL